MGATSATPMAQAPHPSMPGAAGVFKARIQSLWRRFPLLLACCWKPSFTPVDPAFRRASEPGHSVQLLRRFGWSSAAAAVPAPPWPIQINGTCVLLKHCVAPPCPMVKLPREFGMYHCGIQGCAFLTALHDGSHDVVSETPSIQIVEAQDGTPSVHICRRVVCGRGFWPPG